MRVAWGVGITAGWGETEVFMEVSSRRLAIVQHCHLPAYGLLSLLSLLSAFLLTGIKRNQVGLGGWCYTFFDIWAMSTRTWHARETTFLSDGLSFHLLAALATCLVARVLRLGSESLPWLLCFSPTYPSLF